MCVMLFKMRKCVLELACQIGPKYFNTHTLWKMREGFKEVNANL